MEGRRIDSKKVNESRLSPWKFLSFTTDERFTATKSLECIFSDAAYLIKRRLDGDSFSFFGSDSLSMFQF